MTTTPNSDFDSAPPMEKQRIHSQSVLRAVFVTAFVGSLLAFLILFCHQFVRGLFFDEYALDVIERKRDEVGFAHRILLPPKIAKRDRDLDSQSVLYENGFISRPSKYASRWMVENEGLGYFNLSQKSVWLSSLDNQPIEGRQFRLGVIKEIHATWMISAFGLALLSGVGLIRLRKKKPIQQLLRRGLYGGAIAITLLSLSSILLHPKPRLEPRTVEDLPYFGSQFVTHSDASNWTSGAYQMLIGNHEGVISFRPTVSLFYAALINLTNRIQSIPYFFMGLGLVAALWVALTFPRSIGFIAIWILFMIGAYTSMYLDPLKMDTLLMDFPSTVFAFIGLFLMCSGIHRNEEWKRHFIVGCLAMGIVSAIRGPHLIGGAIFMIMLALRKSNFKKHWWIWGSGFVCLLGPLFIDSSLRSSMNVSNNLMIGLHGIAHFEGDPGRMWDESTASYAALNPSKGTVLKEYFQYMASPAGLKQIPEFIHTAFWKDIAVFRDGFFVLCLLVFSLIVNINYGAGLSKKRRICGVFLGLLPVVYLLIMGLPGRFPELKLPALDDIMFIGGMSLLWAFSYHRRHWCTFLFSSIYLGGQALFIAIANLGAGRTLATYQWCCLAALAAFIIESAVARAQADGDEIEPRSPNRWVTGFSLVTLLVIGFLYLGGLSSWRYSESLTTQLVEKTHLLKISEDSVLDRDMYWNANGPAYFPYSNAPVGSVVPAKRDVRFEGSYYTPNPRKEIDSEE